jgi:hypothetical protein
MGKHLKTLLRLLNFYNNMCTSGETPREWSTAVIIPIFKKGCEKDPEN